MDSAAKQNLNSTWTKIVSKFSGNFGSYRTRENSFDKTREHIGEFSNNFQKIYRKPQENYFRLISWKIIFDFFGKLSAQSIDQPNCFFLFRKSKKGMNAS